MALQAPSLDVGRVLTVNVPDGAPPSAVTHAENSDVLPPGAVAVAVIASPAVTASARPRSIAASRPRSWRRSARAEQARALAVARGVAARARVELDAVVPRSRGERPRDHDRVAAVRGRARSTGKFWRSFAPVSASPVVVRRDAVAPRSMPSPPFPSIAFCVTCCRSPRRIDDAGVRPLSTITLPARTRCSRSRSVAAATRRRRRRCRVRASPLGVDADPVAEDRRSPSPSHDAGRRRPCSRR